MTHKTRNSDSTDVFFMVFAKVLMYLVNMVLWQKHSWNKMINTLIIEKHSSKSKILYTKFVLWTNCILSRNCYKQSNFLFIFWFSLMKKTIKKPKDDLVVLEEELEIVVPNAQKALQRMFHNWRLLPVKGMFLILFGILALVFPQLTLLVLLWYLAIMLVIIGGFLMVWSIGHIKQNKHRYLRLLEGLFDIVIGLIIISDPGMTLQLLILFIVVWAFFKGIFQIIHAIKIKKHVGHFVFNAVLLIAFSVVLYLNPFGGAIAMTYFLGIFGIVFGIAMASLGFRLKHISAEDIKKPKKNTKNKNSSNTKKGNKTSHKTTHKTHKKTSSKPSKQTNKGWSQAKVNKK